MNKHLDPGSLIVALVTLLLFVIALFTKGLTHDLFLEAGIFLISVKIILLSYKNGVSVSRLERKLDGIVEILASKSSQDKTRQSPTERQEGSIVP